MPHEFPGLNPQRVLSLMRSSIKDCELDLSGFTVLTEAATGAYVVTPLIAAMAGAERVYALTRSTRHGSVEQVVERTMALAALAGVDDRIKVLVEKSQDLVGSADIVTNCGHVRPIDARMVSWMKPGAVIPLMYESWELRPGDVDVVSCMERGIRLTGTNERHPVLDVFSYLGTMAIKLLLDAGVAVNHSRILIVCDNLFGGYIEAGLRAANASTECRAALGDIADCDTLDAILVAVTPTGHDALTQDEIASIASHCPGAVVVIFWGDVDRAALAAAGSSFWPIEAPDRGHMGILPSDLGPDAIVRLQTGSLRAAEALLRYANDPDHPAHDFGQPV